ncbi:MAG: hypothetical protein A3K65_02820 [Euryarchaeota archaeon RBG_16_68_12]|nr:MAG: hypothetical protein A3K65_02820 [Euryarchaeota archaeon RBG_16_68_12]
MKYVYCPSCDEVSVLSSMEDDRCQRCRRPAFPVRVSRRWQYWASAGVLLAGTALVVVTDLPQVELRFGLLLPFLLVAFSLSTWGLRAAKAGALARGRAGRARTG